MKKWERHRHACLCLSLFKVVKEMGLGEPFGMALLAKTSFGLSRFISMGKRSSWAGESGVRYPSGTWPDKALERGLPRPLSKREEKWGWASTLPASTTHLFASKKI